MMATSRTSWAIHESTRAYRPPKGTSVSSGTLANSGSFTPAALAAELTSASFAPCAIKHEPSIATHSPAFGPDSCARHCISSHRSFTGSVDFHVSLAGPWTTAPPHKREAHVLMFAQHKRHKRAKNPMFVNGLMLSCHSILQYHERTRANGVVSTGPESSVLAEV